MHADGDGCGPAAFPDFILRVRDVAEPVACSSLRLWPGSPKETLDSHEIIMLGWERPLLVMFGSRTFYFPGNSLCEIY